MKTSTRNSFIELLRLFAMFLILACHFIIHINWHLLEGTGWKSAFANVGTQTGQIGVVIFFIITGWFMYSKPFSLTRVIKVWTQVFLYSVIIVLFGLIVWKTRGIYALQSLFENSESLLNTLRQTFFPILFGEYWFMTSYVVLLLLSPFINIVISHCSAQQLKTLIIGLLIVSALPLLGTQIGLFNGVAYAITCYLIGAALHADFISSNISLFLVFAIMTGYVLISLSFNYLALRDNAIIHFFGWPQQLHNGIQPMQIIAGAAIFAWVSKESHSYSWSSMLINRAATATFGVYLIHESYVGFRLVWGAVNAIIPAPQGVCPIIGTGVITLLALYTVLLLISMTIDTLVVHPLQRGVEWLINSRLLQSSNNR